MRRGGEGESLMRLERVSSAILMRLRSIQSDREDFHDSDQNSLLGRRRTEPISFSGSMRKELPKDP